MESFVFSNLIPETKGGDSNNNIETTEEFLKKNLALGMNGKKRQLQTAAVNDSDFIRRSTFGEWNVKGNRKVEHKPTA